MKKIMGMTFGGLQKKMIRLVLAVLFVTIGIYTAVTIYQNNMLKDVVEETRVVQEQAISQSSRETMTQILERSFVTTTGLEAQVVDNEFAEVVNNVVMLQSMAQGLFENKDSLQPVEYGLPDPSKDGTASAMVLCEEGVDYRSSEYLGIIAHMSSPMIAMLESSGKISACYIGLADGTDLCVDTVASNKYDESGELINFPVRQRPWYKGAEEKGDIFFTGIIRDAFTNQLCVTCSIPIFVDGEMIGVGGIDLVLDDINSFLDFSDGEEGHVFIVNDSGQVILSSSDSILFNEAASDNTDDLRNNANKELAGFVTKAMMESTDLSEITIDGKEYYMAGAPMPTIGWSLISAIEKEVTQQPEILLLRKYDDINKEATAKFRKGTAAILWNIAIVILLMIIVGTWAALSASRRIVKPIEEMTKDINHSSRTGQLFTMKDAYRTDDEIELLAEAFWDLSKKTKQYIQNITEITREKERVSTELHMANRIQNSMLPGVFPPYPDRMEFDIYASMGAAREVGGDFYDFFLIDDDHLCMVMADVSGKGIPAALFMMISKVIIQSCAMLGRSASETLIKTNEAICSSNQEEMFVTVWLGILEISTGKIKASNAGHEYPALMKDGKFSLLKDPHGLVIGGMDGVEYLEYEIDLKPGDKLFLYTDGVPEATDEDYNMFGTDRMIDVLNKDVQATPRQLLENMQIAVEHFVDGAEQFDDMTMLCLEYKGRK